MNVARLLLLAIAIPGSLLCQALNPRLEREAMQLLDEYMDAWNAKDLPRWEKTFQFPHYRFAGGQMTVLEKPGVQAPISSSA